MNLKSLFFALMSFLLISTSYAQTVRVSGRKVLLNGSEYKIHGICYSRGGAGSYAQDIPLLQEANINTIRVYSPITDQAELDAFANAGIKIIMHLDENNFEGYINQYKNHNAILFWEFGNEFNYHPEWFDGNLWNWYGKLEACAVRAHQLDPNHPVTTAHGELPTVEVLNACPSVDVWGMNLYRWDNDVPAINDLNARLAANKAIYVSEAGGDGYNKIQNAVNEADQANANGNILNGIVGKYDICAGVTLFEFCDEWWKAGNDGVQNPGGSAPNSSGVPYDGSADEEYWGIVRRDRSKKQTFYVVRDIYATITDGGGGGGGGASGVTGLGGTYTIKNRNSGLVMDVAENGNPNNGTNILQWTATGNPNQQFILNEVSTGVYSIINVQTGKAGDISDVSTENFATFHQWDYVGGANQHYKIEDAGDGFYKLRAMHSNKILEVGYASTEAGADINQYDDNGQICGHWQLIPVGGPRWSTTVEAENYLYMQGIETEVCSEGGLNVDYIDNGDWMVYEINLPESGSYKVDYRVATASDGGQLQLEKAAGASYGVVNIPGTGGWQNWTTISHTVNLPAGAQQIAIKSLSNGWNINWIKFTKVGAGLAAKKSIETVATEVEVFPNPFTDYVTVKTAEEVATITVVDILGNIVVPAQEISKEDKIDLSQLKKGLYLLQIDSKASKKVTRIIKN